jgi:hypothetical protein
MQEEENQKIRRMLEALVGLNKILVKEQYRMLALRTHNQKKIKMVDPEDPLFFYLN